MEGRGSRRSRNNYMDRDVILSRRLSLILRHKALKFGFAVKPGGYVSVKALLQHKTLKGFTPEFTEADIRRVVATNSKQRFSLKNDEETGELMICANQGHSFEIPGMEFEPITDARRFPVVVHGTFLRNWDQIKGQGLKRMGRTHIHFAQGEPGDDGVISGMRRSCQVMIFINLALALKDGIKFFLSKNGVVLTPGDAEGTLRPKYFSRVIRVSPRQELPFDKF